MDSNKKWFFRALLLIIAGLGFVAVVNYVLDPYGIFRKDFSWQFIEPNKHYIKVRHVTEHPDRFDCFLFGSSRANHIDVRKIKGGRCYNMQHAGGLPREYLDSMKYMVKKGVKIEFALIALDEVSYNYNPKEHLSQPMRHPYPPVLNEYRFPYFLQYLFYWYDWDIMETCLSGYWNKLRGHRGEDIVRHDIYETGQTFSPNADHVIEKDPAAHANRKEFQRRFRPEDIYMDGVVRDIKELIEFARQNKIQLKFFVVPLYKTKYLDAGPDEMDRFRREVAGLTDFWDFSGLNSITINTYYYYEAWHFRGIVGDMILSRMFGYQNTNVPKDFGVFVTNENIDRHLQYLRQQMKDLDGK